MLESIINLRLWFVAFILSSCITETRVDNIQKNINIIESENLGDIHPDSLQKFIESQNK